MADLTPTRGAELALAEEKSFIETGFGFLDEKRMLLAATLLKELAAWKAARDHYDLALQTAKTALQAAILRHGLEGVQHYPVAPGGGADIVVETENLLGLPLMQPPDFIWLAAQTPDCIDASPQAEACRTAFAALVPLAAAMAARQGNVYRLIREYRSTERRARALENVLLPETKAQLAAINDYLDEADQEEAIRIRNAAR